MEDELEPELDRCLSKMDVVTAKRIECVQFISLSAQQRRGRVETDLDGSHGSGQSN